ncbi:MAG: PD40 domain-containing protein [Deltaproteobacteria bacterium]|nr:PD40 domain-containing protein [Deltaproteobacteria bacterium]
MDPRKRATHGQAQAAHHEDVRRARFHRATRVLASALTCGPFLVSSLVSSFACANKESDAGAPYGNAVPDGGASADGGRTADGGTTASSTLSLDLEPAASALEVTFGVPSTIDFALWKTDANGARTNVTAFAVFRTKNALIGTFSTPSNRLVVSGERAGIIVVEAFYSGSTVETEVAVSLVATTRDPSLPADIADRFGGPIASVSSGQQAPALLYPEDGVVVPKNLMPMEIQWSTPSSFDAFRVTLEDSQGRFRAALFTPGHEGKAKFEHDVWARLLEHASGGEVLLQVAGIALNAANGNGEIQASTTQRIKVAQTILQGTVYYWALDTGRIHRIQAGSDVAEDFFVPPTSPDDANNRCVGCHTLSRDGRKMAFEYWGGWQWHGIIDVVAPEPALVVPYVFQANFSAFDPSGDFLLSVLSGELSIRDGASGAVIEQVATNAPSTMPAWSPDGTTISYISKVHDPFGDIDFFEGDLVVHRNFRDAGSTSQVLVAADGAANTYPSFSPDGQTIAFSRGPFSRSHTQWNQDDTAGLSPGDLFLVRADGRDPAVKLAAASRDGQALLPAFSPFEDDDYAWIAFFSRRDYGHITAGSHRRQVWVTAVSKKVMAGADPSSPAFWLPGQDSATENMSAYWAPDPCRTEGQTCAVDAECCQASSTGNSNALVCRPTGSGGVSQCVDQGQACAFEGDRCTTDADCCPLDGVLCAGTPGQEVCIRPNL